MRVLAAFLLAGCFRPMPTPPTRGYGAPYQGSGETIFVKDSRTDWDITEGSRKITAEQALEASGDPEYETRRQIAKAHNARLYREAQRNRRNGYRMIVGAVAAIVGGAIVSYALAPRVLDEDVTPPTAMDPEMISRSPGAASALVSILGTVLTYGGIAGVGYGVYGAMKPPRYHAWRIPGPLNRPAYIRRFTEEYNAKLETSGAAEPGPARPPGELRPPPIKPPRSIPRPRGGRR